MRRVWGEISPSLVPFDVVRALVMTWFAGGNLPPLLAVGSLLDRCGHDVTVLCSGRTRDAARRLGLDVTGYRRSPDPNTGVAFEAQAELMMASAAGAEIALDARDALAELRPNLAVVDCMLPAAIAAARAPGARGRHRSSTSCTGSPGRRCCRSVAPGPPTLTASR